MVELAKFNPQELASYSVSDAVATYYLYTNYIHAFIFSLCTIIPLPAHSVLRKGTGTLCEALLMAEAARAAIIAPNKTLEREEKFYKNRLMESETYVGGHVECIEAGVFRDDIPIRFAIKREVILKLEKRVKEIICFAIEKEKNLKLDQVENINEIENEIKMALKKVSEKV